MGQSRHFSTHSISYKTDTYLNGHDAALKSISTIQCYELNSCIYSYSQVKTCNDYWYKLDVFDVAVVWSKWQVWHLLQ